MNIFHAAVLGIVQGITEFLPVSSTGHLILTQRLLGIPQTEFVKSFDIAIQLGSILAVCVLYWRTLATDFKTLLRVFAAFVPTAVLGFLFYKVIKKFLLGNEQTVLWALLLGGIFIIIFERFHREKDNATDGIAGITFRQAILIGVFQSIAMIPGVSRSAATILGGLALGLKRKTIVEFSFLLAVPTMLAATGLDLLKSAGSFHSGNLGFLGVGFITSFIVAILAIKFLLYFVQRNNFIPFGIYRIALAILFWTFI